MQVDATIIKIINRSPKVKSFLLDLGGEPFTFFPGQWLDFYIDLGHKLEVGGFSITSSPLDTTTIELAIKRQDHGNPSIYLHDHAKVGDTFIISGGFGDFYYDYNRDRGYPLVLIAGGIGITPLISIIRYVDQAHPDVRVTLIYSAPQPSELAFLDELQEISARNDHIQCVFTTTQPHDTIWKGNLGRIDQALIKKHLPANEAIFYLCGPPQMLEDLSESVTNLGVMQSNIRVEKWW